MAIKIQLKDEEKLGLYILIFPTGTTIGFYCKDDAALIKRFFEDIPSEHVANFEKAIIASVMGNREPEKQI